MHLDHYELINGRGYTTFEFVSEGKKGRIIKLIQFQPTTSPKLYNLAFGDQKEASNEFDDFAVTNNGDAEKVLTTVAVAIRMFLEYFPDRWVYAKGSTAARSRLYRMLIDKNLALVEHELDIMGEYNGEWSWYEKGKNYNAFVVRIKKQ